MLKAFENAKLRGNEASCNTVTPGACRVDKYTMATAMKTTENVVHKIVLGAAEIDYAEGHIKNLNP